MANDKAFKVKNTLELAGYNTSKAVTAVDVFVYDTSKDSDGGAWRKRTHHTSWYNETLNTATRGSRREFPAVAVIVAESNKVTIYDGDDPALPMWMVFNLSGIGNFHYLNGNFESQSDYSCVSAGQGEIVVGLIAVTNTYAGLIRWRFISDEAFRHTLTSTFGRVSGKHIYSLADRHTNGTAYTGFNRESLPDIINGNCRDVAMTVLPNAPIDAATGLPVPTIAVATDGGVSVIRDDGTVVDGTNTSGDAYEITGTVAFDENNRLWYVQDSASQRDGYVVNIPSSDWTADNGNNLLSGASGWSFSKSGENGNIKFVGTSASGLSYENIGSDAGVTFTDYTEDQIATGSNSPLPSLFAYASSTYNTGWMNGDIKLATLSDTDATNVTGSELVTNGTFDTDLTGWNISTDVAHNNGTVELTNTTQYGAIITQTLTGLEVGKRYILTFHVIGVSGNYGWYCDNFLGSYVQGVTTATGTTFRYEVEATSTSGTVTFKKFNAGTVAFDNISVRLAEEDRSVNGNGLQVFGTVNKTPVATGADLVAYSGFSNSNYLMQPYNSDLDFTTEFCYNVWAYKPSDRSENSIISRGQNLSTNGFFYLGTNNSGQIYGYIGPAQINTSVTAASGVWNMYTVARSSGTVSFYLNGKQVYSVSNTNSLSNTVAKLYVGTSSYGVNIPYSGSIALARASATAPSPEQIKKIYEDEKVLFQEGAQATLYGSSDAVTALAYDDSTNLLHVGTSAGRSVFQGLRRVDNTTTAVGAAISASNGLVAEE